MVRAIERGDFKVLAWVGDEIPFQDRAIFVSTKTADDRRDTIQRFLPRLQKGAQDYHDAFIGPDERPKDGPSAQATLELIASMSARSRKRCGSASPMSIRACAST